MGGRRGSIHTVSIQTLFSPLKGKFIACYHPIIVLATKLNPDLFLFVSRMCSHKQLSPISEKVVLITFSFILLHKLHYTFGVLSGDDNCSTVSWWNSCNSNEIRPLPPLYFCFWPFNFPPTTLTLSPPESIETTFLFFYRHVLYSFGSNYSMGLAQ